MPVQLDATPHGSSRLAIATGAAEPVWWRFWDAIWKAVKELQDGAGAAPLTSEITTVATKDTTVVEAWTDDDGTFIAWGDFYDGSTYRHPLNIYQKVGNELQIAQTLPAVSEGLTSNGFGGIYDIEVFQTVDDLWWMVVVQYYDGALGNAGFDLAARFYKKVAGVWTFVNQFSTNGGYQARHAVLGSDDYVYIACEVSLATGTLDYTQNSIGVKYNTGTTQFASFETIATSGARCLQPYEVAGVQRLAIAEYYDGTTYRFDSRIIPWQSSVAGFDPANPVVLVPTAGASDVIVPIIDGIAYPWFANSNNDAPATTDYGDGFDIYSNMYRDNGTTIGGVSGGATISQAWFQHKTSNCIRLKHWEKDGRHLFAVCNTTKGDTATSSFLTEVEIMEWLDGRPVRLGSVRAFGPYDAAFFDDDEGDYFAIANSYDGNDLTLDSPLLALSI